MFNRQPDPTPPVCHFFYSVFSGSGRVAVLCPPLEILFKIFLHCTKSGTIDLDILTMRCSNLSWNFVIIIYLIKCFLIFVLPVDWGKLIDFLLLAHRLPSFTSTATYNKLWSMDTSKTRRVTVSDTRQSTTLLWYSYNTCWTTKNGVLNKIGFFFTLALLDRCPTHISLIRVVSDNSDKCLKHLYFSFGSTLRRDKSYICVDKCWSITGLKKLKLITIFLAFLIVDE